MFTRQAWSLQTVMPAQRTTPATGAAPTPAAAPTPGSVPVAAPWRQQWLTPLVILAATTLFLNQQNRAFDAVNKRIDVLREDLQASETRQREDVQAVREDVQAVREDVQAVREGLARLEGKVDRLLESR